ncbi:transposase [Streptomyces sp. R44]|uniref:Transposase n=1 Tax=Streptomyces sp. R44 TaxID=3238633 RepID=A0AB39SNS9_9ACTN
MIDSPSVEAADVVAGSSSRGFDGGKLVNDRRRHVVVGTLGRHAAGRTVAVADIGDRTAAEGLLAQVAAAHHLLELVSADGGYPGGLHPHRLRLLACHGSCENKQVALVRTRTPVLRPTVRVYSPDERVVLYEVMRWFIGAGGRPGGTVPHRVRAGGI